MNAEVLSALVNFSAVVFILVYFGRKPILEFFQQRSAQISVFVQEAKVLSDQSRKALDEWSARHAQAEAEIKQQQKDAEASVAKYREATLARAQAEALRIAEDAKLVLAAERLKAKKVLQQQLAEESLAQARRYLQTHVEKKDSKHLLTDYLERVTNGHAG